MLAFKGVWASKCDFENEVFDPTNVSIEEFEKIQDCLRQITEEDLPPMKTDRCKNFFKFVKLVWK